MDDNKRMSGLFGLADLARLYNDPKPFGLLGQFQQSPPPAQGLGLLGYSLRDSLYPGEDNFFRSNPSTAGMATSMGDIALNPYSPSSVNRGAVAKNEAFRLLLGDLGTIPSFPTTPEQRNSFAGTAYGNNEDALKSTIAARIYSGDPSAKATPAQTNWVAQFLSSRFLPRD